jgi:hypothetical protein
VIQQVVSKFMLKRGLGTLYDMFPVFVDNTLCLKLMDLRGSVPLTRHILAFDIAVPSATKSDQLHPDKEQLRSMILALWVRGMSYRQIAATVGLHWTRIGQIVKGSF